VAAPSIRWPGLLACPGACNAQERSLPAAAVRRWSLAGITITARASPFYSFYSRSGEKAASGNNLLRPPAESAHQGTRAPPAARSAAAARLKMRCAYRYPTHHHPIDTWLGCRHALSSVNPKPMINEIKISNYRCYKSLTIKDLGRINIIVGENGSGKTA